MVEASLSIWTLGHSKRTLEEFLDLLVQYRIEILVDVRHFPYSRYARHFNQDSLAQALPIASIRYEHLVELGGRRRPRPDSHNLAWHNMAFRGYADYMETQPFQDGLERLLKIAQTGRTAIMCAEAVWWRCHRSLIADKLKELGARVFHIVGANKVQEHPFTAAAQLVDGHLSYR